MNNFIVIIIAFCMGFYIGFISGYELSGRTMWNIFIEYLNETTNIVEFKALRKWANSIFPTLFSFKGFKYRK